MYNHSPLHIGNLCKALENYSWTGLLLAIEHKTVDVDIAFAEFNAIVHLLHRQLNITYVNETLPCVKG